MVMDKIKISDINFGLLEELSFQGSIATVYKSGNDCVKIFKSMDNSSQERLYNKLTAMDGIKIDGVIMPSTLIMEGFHLRGYIMPYFADSMNLNDYFNRYQYVESSDMLDAIKKASLILRKIHDEDIICQDLSFENILINDFNDVAFCDMDGCHYKNHRSDYVSLILKRYIVDYRKNDMVASKNFDRLSMFLSMIYIMYFREIQKLSNRKYDYLANNLKTLENLRKYYDILKNKHQTIPEIPYLDEIIDDSDEFLINRGKQVNLVQRLYAQFFH